MALDLFYTNHCNQLQRYSWIKSDLSFGFINLKSLKSINHIPTPANIYLLKVNNRNTRKRCEISSKLKIKIPERRHLAKAFSAVQPIKLQNSWYPWPFSFQVGIFADRLIFLILLFFWPSETYGFNSFSKNFTSLELYSLTLTLLIY